MKEKLNDARQRTIYESKLESTSQWSYLSIKTGKTARFKIVARHVAYAIVRTTTWERAIRRTIMREHLLMSESTRDDFIISTSLHKRL